MTENNTEFNATTKKDLFYIDPRAIIVMEGWNSRMFFDGIEELASQIEAQGVLNPISVQEVKEDGVTKYKLIDGERRYRAVMSLLERGVDIKRVPAIKLALSLTEEELLIQQLQRNEGRNFTEYEYGIFTKKMIDRFGYTIREVAQKVGKNEGGLSYAIHLLDLDPRVQALLRDNKISGSNVRRVYKYHKGDEEGAVQEILGLQEKAEEREKESGKKETLSLKDLSTKGKTIVSKDSEIIKKGLTTLFRYLKESTLVEFNPYNALDRLNKGELINDILGIGKNGEVAKAE